MDSGNLLSWLKKYKLLSFAKNHSVHFRNVLKKTLKARLKEDILIIGDYGLPRRRVAPLMTGSYYLSAKKLGLNVKVIMQNVKNANEKADDYIVQSFKKMSKSGIIVLTLSNKLGRLGGLGKSYRHYAKEKKHRFVSTPGMASIMTKDFYSITSALNINYAKLRRECTKLKRAFDWGREVNITTKAGTDLYLNITGSKSISNDGKYDLPGKGGNIPTGEVYIAPKINSAEGKVVIDCSSRNRDGTSKIDKPIIMTIKKGMATRIEGGHAANLLKKTVRWAERKAKNPSMTRQIGELGIGMNPKANLTGAMVVDEKVLGTAHIALGNNYWFGGDVFTIIHLDQVFKSPRLFIDNKEYKIPKKKDFL